jgi:hypothetical protein
MPIPRLTRRFSFLCSLYLFNPMTTTINAPTELKTFQVSYRVVSYYDIQVERPANITEEELIASITRDEALGGNGEESGGWDGLKEAWRTQDVSLILDEDGDQAF